MWRWGSVEMGSYIAIHPYVVINQKVDKKTETLTCSQLSVPYSLKTVRFLYTNKIGLL